jgi:hypothetical protein
MSHATDIVSSVKISQVWQALGGPALRRGRGVAFWRQADGLSVSLNDAKGTWYDFPAGESGGVLALVSRIRRGDRQESLRWLADFAGVAMDDSPLSTEDRASWATERRAIERDLPAARLWRRVALALGGKLLDSLKAPTGRPNVGEICSWERRLARWRRLYGAELVAE